MFRITSQKIYQTSVENKKYSGKQHNFRARSSQGSHITSKYFKRLPIIFQAKKRPEDFTGPLHITALYYNTFQPH